MLNNISKEKSAHKSVTLYTENEIFHNYSFFFIKDAFLTHLLNLYLKNIFLAFNFLNKNACHFPRSNVFLKL